ncbi:RNase adapter RapZ [Acidaminococcus timonensis]|uniref:RNase adapter RapZ n=1 Tax=Acidaminococcus TaxID=904 RepID=UPI00345D01D6
MPMTRTLLITGMSGAGKTQVMRTLEDLGYFCVDNLPPTFIPKFIELCLTTKNQNAQLALVVDIRGGKFFKDFSKVLDKLTAGGIHYELVFLDADDATLVRRYKETRRRHPLAGDKGLSADIAKEREILSQVRQRATTIIDTSRTSTKQLRNKIVQLFGKGGELPPMNIVVQSFGFKYGIPLDCDMVFDVRFLPNPFYIPELKNQCGNDQPVIDYIQEKPVTGEFEKRLFALIQFLLPQYVQEGKSQLMIGVGCTGGRHRSVFIANQLGKFIETCGYGVKVIHRDLIKK